MSTTPTPSEPRDEHDPTIADDRDAAAGPPAATESHGAPLIADEPRAEAAPEQPAAEPIASPAPEPIASPAPEPIASTEPEPASAAEPDADSRWAPPPERPEPETASAPLAADPAPELVEPQPAPAATPSAADRDVDDAASDAEVRSASSGSAPESAHPAAQPQDPYEGPLVDRGADHPADPQPEATVGAAAPEAPAVAAPVTAAAPVAMAAAPDAAPAAPAAAPAPAPQVVYVPAPSPPRKKGNRGMGVGIALAATPVFAAAYAGLALLFVAIANGGIALSQAAEFFTAPVFWLPIIAFALFYVLLALIVNRAGWWAHVLGGFVVALLVYGSFLVATLLTADPFGVPGEVVQQFVAQQLTNPIGWAAAIAAREVPVWVGGLVAKRGRSVKSRNVEARAAYERELAESRASRPAAA